MFFHDDWKISRTVTLNIGPRHEYEGPTTERYNRSNRGFDMTTPNPVEAEARAAYARSPIPETRGGGLPNAGRPAVRHAWAGSRGRCGTPTR